MEKETYDMRGGQSRITRLWAFSKESYVHMLFYRILIPVAIIAAIIFAIQYIYPSLFVSMLFKLIFILVWVLFIPQVFETSKGLSIIATNGFIHGMLNKMYLESAAKYERHPLGLLYKAFPYFAIIVWIAGLISISALWFI
jgi:hypothetical protein